MSARTNGPLRILAHLTIALAVLFLLPPALHAEEGPWPTQQVRTTTFRGDGMTLVIEQLDVQTGMVQGTIAISGGRGMPFMLRLARSAAGKEVGQGQVQSPQGNRPFSTLETGPGAARVTYEGRHYDIAVVQAAPQPTFPDPTRTPPTPGPRPTPSPTPVGPAPSVTLTGSGIHIVIDNITPPGGVSGRITIDDGQPMALRMQVRRDAQGKEVGQGQVQTPQGAKPISSIEDDEEHAHIRFEGRTYRVTFNQSAPEERDASPAPIPLSEEGPGPAPTPEPNVGGFQQVTLAGDGITVVITGADQQGVFVGHLTIGNGGRMTFRLQARVDAQGNEVASGHVETPRGSKPIATIKEGDNGARFTFDGQTYRTRFVPQAARTPTPVPIPQTLPQPQSQEGEQATSATFRGDGMTVVITAQSPDGRLGGHLSIGSGPRMPLELRVSVDATGNEVGNGQVRTASGLRPISSRDGGEDAVRVTFEGRSYVLRLAGSVPGPVAIPQRNQAGSNGIRPQESR
ncbi:MAG: hypothetical protein GY946_31115 [bacterium]|nr:hypothetical protein [bacterium]